ncbi:MAG: hypothetical protein DDT31_00971 [Syntrophomonadaceae bacterium]|nr:hypothetical protein [Bacillota bacterium]
MGIKVARIDKGMAKAMVREGRQLRRKRKSRKIATRPPQRMLRAKPDIEASINFA